MWHVAKALDIGIYPLVFLCTKLTKMLEMHNIFDEFFRVKKAIIFNVQSSNRFSKTLIPLGVRIFNCGKVMGKSGESTWSS